MQRAHSLYGRLSWSSLVLPAARLATEGFVVTKALASEIWRLDKIKDLPSSTRLKNFLYKNGKPLQPGETVTRPDLGHTLERIAYGGAEEFYSGRLGSQIVDEIREIGGLLSKVDLMNYKEIIKEPLTSSFKDYRVITAPPPSSGPAFILALNILEGFNFTKDDINNPLFWHRFIEVLKFETANKNRLGDPDYEPAVLEIARHMMLKSTADNLRRQMKDDAVLSDYSIGVNVSQRSQVGTTHVSIVDSKELYVSVTSTLNYYFGSGFMTATGIIMNDELTDFASKDMTGAEQNNMPKPGKRPLSSMVPTVIYHPLRACIHRMAVGGSNGSHIPSGVLASIINVLTFGLNLTEAVEHPRLFADLPTNPVLAESGFDEKILSQLEVWGHNITRTPGLSVINAVMRNNKTVTAHSDSRKYGDAVIY